MSDNDPGILEKIGMKVGDLIGRYLPEPDEEKGGHALNVAIVGVLVFTFITLLAGGLFAAVVEFVVLSAYVILGMYAGGPVFLRLQTKNGPTPPNTTPPGATPPTANPPTATPPTMDPQARRRRSGNPFAGN